MLSTAICVLFTASEKAWENYKNVTKCGSSSDWRQRDDSFAGSIRISEKFPIHILEGCFLQISEIQVGDVYLYTATLYHRFHWQNVCQVWFGLFVHTVTQVKLDTSFTDYNLYITSLFILYGHPSNLTQ